MRITSFKDKFGHFFMLPADDFFYLSSALIGAESQDFRHGHRTEYSAHVFNPAQFSPRRHGHPVQNDEIFFVSKSVGAQLM